jgi:DNA-binding HxlR family transcriptional regulator
VPKVAWVVEGGDVKRYGQYCPVARAAEVLAERWTLLVIRELLCGEERFNAIARGVPRLSPSLLAARLRELQRAGLVRREVVGGEPRYRLTEAGADLEPLVRLLGEWGVRWMYNLRADEFDPVILMLDIKRQVRVPGLPERRITVELCFPDAAPSVRRWWLVMSRSDGADVCEVDPGRPIDVWLETAVSVLTRVWMGDISWSAALREHLVRLSGDHCACQARPSWLGTSSFANVVRADKSLPR